MHQGQLESEIVNRKKKSFQGKVIKHIIIKSLTVDENNMKLSPHTTNINEKK